MGAMPALAGSGAPQAAQYQKTNNTKDESVRDLTRPGPEARRIEFVVDILMFGNVLHARIVYSVGVFRLQGFTIC